MGEGAPASYLADALGLERLELARGLAVGLLDDAALQLVGRGQGPVLGRQRGLDVFRG